MNAFARSLANAQQTVSEIDTKDVSSLAYVSSLVALEALLPVESAAEMEFTVSVLEDDSVAVDVGDSDIDDDMRAAINLIASHYFQARRRGIPVSVH